MRIRKLLNAATIMIMATVLTKVLGFVKDIILAKVFGTSNIMDAYVIATTIPNIILACFGVAISNSIVSLFSSEKKRTNEENAKKVLNVANFIMITTSVIFVIINMLFANIIVKMIASGFDEETVILATKLTKITSISIIFISLNYVLNGFLQYKNKFFLTGFSGSFSSIIIIVLMFMGITNIYIYTFSLIIGALIQFILVVITSNANGYKFKISIKEGKNYLISIVNLSLPLIIGYSIQQINVVVDKTIASSLFDGAVSSLNYANIVIVAIVAVLIDTISTIQYSKMSKIENDEELYKESNRTIDIMSLLIIPITILVILLSKPIIYVLFYGGKFDLEALNNTSIALSYYAIGIIFTAYRYIFIRISLIKNDSKKPMISNIIAVILNIVLNIILSKLLGYKGLAIATSLSSMISTIVFLSLIKIQFKGIFNRDNFNRILKILLIASICTLIVIIILNYIDFKLYQSKLSTFTYIIVVSIIFSIIYIIGLKILKIDIIKEFKKMFNNS